MVPQPGITGQMQLCARHAPSPDGLPLNVMCRKEAGGCLSTPAATDAPIESSPVDDSSGVDSSPVDSSPVDSSSPVDTSSSDTSSSGPLVVPINEGNVFIGSGGQVNYPFVADFGKKK
jgi:hypothetical protein